MAKGSSKGKASSAVGGANNTNENQASGGALQAGVPNDSTEYYQSGNGMWINYDLRNGNTNYWSDSDRDYLKEMDIATDGALSENALYRAVDASAVFGNISDQDYENIVGTLQQGNDYLGRGNYAASLRNQARAQVAKATGKEITDKGFMSTTATAKVAEEWGSFSGANKPMVIKFTNAKNQKGVDLSKQERKLLEAAGNGNFSGQDERLLARNTSYKINKISAKNGQIYVEAEFTNNKKR